jgi:predicted dehydrogenase
MTKKRRSNDLIRVGVVGIGRGQGFARGATEALGMKLVALCDTWGERVRSVGKELGVAAYTDYARFLEHDLDAVILANYFHQHAPFAIQALQAGKHVMSETSACFTLAQGVALVEAVEQSGRIYMFAENYPYTVRNLEMRRLYRSGAIGEFVYGEGEYIHPGPADDWNRISRGVDHWRNWLPSTYYCTHAIAPLMFITDTLPVKVNAFSLPFRPDDPVRARRPLRNDACSLITVRMDNGAVCKLLQYYLRGHGVWYRVHGSLGLMEGLRGGDTGKVRLIREQYHQRQTTPVEQIYQPDWPREHQAAAQAGHGGGDYFMNVNFAAAIRSGKQPYLDVYRGVAMSMVGIQGWKSVLGDSTTFEIPDFRKKRVRDLHRADHWNPDPTEKPKRGVPKPPCSIQGPLTISKQQLAYAGKNWGSQ